jgi:hypothetical protein
LRPGEHEHASASCSKTKPRGKNGDFLPLVRPTHFALKTAGPEFFRARNPRAALRGPVIGGHGSLAHCRRLRPYARKLHQGVLVNAGSRLKVWSGAGHRVRPAKSPPQHPALRGVFLKPSLDMSPGLRCSSSQHRPAQRLPVAVGGAGLGMDLATGGRRIFV